MGLGGRLRVGFSKSVSAERAARVIGLMAASARERCGGVGGRAAYKCSAQPRAPASQPERGDVANISKRFHPAII